MRFNFKEWLDEENEDILRNKLTELGYKDFDKFINTLKDERNSDTFNSKEEDVLDFIKRKEKKRKISKESKEIPIEKQVVGFFITTDHQLKTTLERELKQLKNNRDPKIRDLINKNNITIGEKLKFNNQLYDKDKIIQFSADLHSLPTNTQKNSDGFANPEQLKNTYKPLYNKNSIWIFRADSFEASKKLGQGQSWCVSNNATYYYSYRFNNEQTQYFIFDYNQDGDARYVNPGVAPPGKYSEWVDKRNYPNEIEGKGFTNLEEYKKYLNNIDPEIIKLLVPIELSEDEKIIKETRKMSDEKAYEYTKQKNKLDAWLQYIEKLSDNVFNKLTDQEKKTFLLKKENLTKNQLEYVENNFVKNYVDDLQDYEYVFEKCVEYNLIKIVTRILSTGYEDSEGYAFPLQYALQYAVKNNNIDMAKLLIANGSNISESDLDAAAKNNNTEMVKLLLDNGIKSYSGIALQKAAINGNLEIVKLFIDDFKKNPEEYSAYAFSDSSEFSLDPSGIALQKAAISGNLDIVKLFIANGSKDPYGTALKNAISNGKKEVFFELYNKYKNEFSQGVLQDAFKNAVQYGKKEMVETLFKYAKEDQKREALELAVRFNKEEEVTEFLLKKGCKDPYGNALSFAVNAGRRKIVQFLLDSGVEDEYETGILIFSVHTGREDMVKLLLDNGCKDPSKLALKYAVKNKNTEIINLLKQKSIEDPQGFPYTEKDF